MTSQNLSALRHISTPKKRDTIINKINRKLPDGQKLRVSRKQFADHKFYIVNADSNVIRLFADARELLRFAIETGISF